MRIAMISPIVGDAFGQERVMRISARLLREAGHAVFFVGDRLGGALPPLDGHHLVPGLSSFNQLTKRATVTAALTSLSHFLRESRVTLVHFIDGFDSRVIDAAAAQYPTVYTAHTVSPTCPASQRLIRGGGICTAKSGYACVVNHRRFGCLSFLKNDAHRMWAVYNFLARRRALRSLPATMAISSYVERTLLADGWPADRVSLCYNPVEIPQDVQPAEDAPPGMILSASRLVKLKGVDHLLRAAAEAPARPIWICGDGEERPALERLAGELGIADRTRFLGAVDYRRIESLMAAAEVVVQPNLGPEGFGLSVAEASALGAPVIVYDVPALNEIVLDGRNGLVVPRGDTAALSVALTRLLSDEELRGRLGAQGPKVMAEKFSPRGHLAATLAAYDRALSRTRKSA